MTDGERPRIVRESEARVFMEGDELCRQYVSSGKVTFGTSQLMPGQRGAIDVGHPESHEVFFVIRGRVLIYTSERDYYELGEGDAILIPEGVPHTLINVGETSALVSWSAAPSP